MSYKTQLKLEDHESPLKLDNRTGEIKEIKRRPNNIPTSKEIFEAKALFKKDYSKSWAYLYDVLTPMEYKVAHKLCQMAEMNTNSLKPLNDATAKTTIANELGIHRNNVDKILSALYYHGVYGRFDVQKEHIKFSKYWVVNPYLSFAGKLITSDTARLFEGTRIYNAFMAED